jgi:mRNA-degrading endonuclease YafQ of YafQ-DinJ toxin-antitoxin module
MPYEIFYTAKYERRLKRFLKQHPELFSSYGKTIEMIKINPHHPSLRLHKLKGALQAFHSVSINIKYRITIEFIIQDKLIIPVMIGCHDEAYR